MSPSRLARRIASLCAPAVVAAACTGAAADGPPPAALAETCVHLVVALDSAAAEVQPQASCGDDGLRLAAGRVRVALDSGIVRIPVTAAAGAKGLAGAVRLYVWDDSLQAMGGMAGGQPPRVVAPANPLPADALAPGAVVQTVGNGQGTSATDTAWVTVRVPPGARRLSLAVHGRARTAPASVPRTAPDSIPAWVHSRENVLRDSPHFDLTEALAGRVLLVRFHPSADVASRQRALDAVWGDVVGGTAVDGAEGEYLVRVPDDGTGRQMRAALDHLRAVPQVAHVLPEYYLP